ncbi:MAG: hypothetical protein JNL42_03010 [Anaerolineae bacterium]|nr:hypothetical protein [Anaerolineae bacterium]
MSNKPSPFDSATLRRMLVAGAVLAVGGIILFVLLWLALGSANMQNFPRLILSLCIPPAIIALLLGGYFLISRR